MGLNNFFDFNKQNKEGALQNLIEKLKKDKGFTDKLALREAEKIIFKPEHLEKIKLNALKNVGLKPGVTFYFNNKEEIKLLARYFNVNFSVMGVEDSSLLLDMLGLLIKRVKVGYDLDGVICEKRELSQKPYKNMSGEERRAYLEKKRKHYLNAKVLRIPLEKDAYIITGRTTRYGKETRQWLDKNNIKCAEIYFNNGASTRDSQIQHKANKINRLALVKYYEDDKKIAKKLEALCPDTKIILIEERKCK